LVENNIKNDVKVNNFSFENLNDFDVEKEVKDEVFNMKVMMKKI
jgi:hypothetical protein